MATAAGTAAGAGAVVGGVGAAATGGDVTAGIGYGALFGAAAGGAANLRSVAGAKAGYATNMNKAQERFRNLSRMDQGSFFDFRKRSTYQKMQKRLNLSSARAEGFANINPRSAGIFTGTMVGGGLGMGFAQLGSNKSKNGTYYGGSMTSRLNYEEARRKMQMRYNLAEETAKRDLRR